MLCASDAISLLGAIPVTGVLEAAVVTDSDDTVAPVLPTSDEDNEEEDGPMLVSVPVLDGVPGVPMTGLVGGDCGIRISDERQVSVETDTIGTAGSCIFDLRSASSVVLHLQVWQVRTHSAVAVGWNRRRRNQRTELVEWLPDIYNSSIMR